MSKKPFQRPSKPASNSALISSESKKSSVAKGLIYLPGFVKPKEKREVMDYLQTLYPIWEMRFSKSNPPPDGQENRRLLRPVYWLGNWQFACLDYYHPPKGIEHRCVKAEDFPPVMAKMVSVIEDMVRSEFLPKDVPTRWHLNTCLINYYGSQIEGTRKIDCARVGEHRDFEPGPVASISFGERALFQFVDSKSKNSQSQVIMQQWLEDCSLQIFGGDRFKKQLFHRVQRVEDKNNHQVNFGFRDSVEAFHTEGFETRRINFTFRYVPTDHIQPLSRLPVALQEDVRDYVGELAEHSDYWRAQL